MLLLELLEALFILMQLKEALATTLKILTEHK
jgi:hypothetical protein